MEDIKFATCPHCGRNDVPVCPTCGQRVPHGTTPGTWLPCCYNPDEVSILQQVIDNAYIEFEAKFKKKGGEKDET